MKMDVDPKVKVTIILVVLLVAGLIVGSVISMITFPKIEKRMEGRFGRAAMLAVRQIYTFRNIIIMTNIILLMGLLVVYIKGFLKTSSSFMLGLSIFVGVLFIQTILSIPILHFILSPEIPVFGLLDLLQNIFETIALIILFYLSME